MTKVDQSKQVTFRIERGRYIFATRDREIWIANDDKDAAIALFVRVVQAFADKGVLCRVDAFERLGPSLKVLRDAGAICRVNPREKPPALAPVRWQMPGSAVPDPPAPVYASWADYLARTTRRERMPRCHAASKKANRKRMLSGSPFVRIHASDVWEVIERARGRCCHCGSLAVENRPSKSNGAPAPWAQVGRRIGSLEHLEARLIGGDNFKANLAWACLWCNTWPQERRKNATDHGGYHPAI